MPLLISIKELKTESQKQKLESFKNASQEKYTLLGGTTYQFSIWAVRNNGKIEIYKTDYDWEGRWVKAKCRPWNK